MYELGLLKKSELDWDKAGVHIKGLKSPDAMKNSYDAAINFGDWVMNTLKPLIEKKIDEKGIKDPQHRAIYEAQLISGMFPDRNAAKAVTEILQQYTKLTKDAENMAKTRKAMNMGEYTAGSWDYQVEALSTQWNNLKEVLGAPLVGEATKMLAEFNKELSRFGISIKDNPEKVKRLAESITILGATLVGAGVVAIIAAMGPAGWLVLSLGALAAAIKYFAPETFNQISKGLSDTWDALKKGTNDFCIVTGKHLS